MREPIIRPSAAATSIDVAGTARYLARAVGARATSDAAAVDALAACLHDAPAEFAPAAYAVADDDRALDLITRAAWAIAA